MVRRTARFHSNQTWRQRSEEPQQLAAPNRLGDNQKALGIEAVNLKNILGDIEPDDRDRRQILDRLAHGRLPSDGFMTTTIMAHRCRSGRRPPHHRNREWCF
jgi:hypothetical protein